jgi:putative peptide maturation dehydrogenase
MFEPRERVQFSLDSILSGGAGLNRTSEWIALAPHTDAETPVDIDEIEMLGTISAAEWMDFDELETLHPRELLDALLDKCLLVAEDGEADRRDRKLRARHWRPASAIVHYASRWQDVGAEDNNEDVSDTLGGQFVDWLGKPPPPVREWADANARRPLPKAPPSPLQELLHRRTTCREFDASRLLGLTEFSALLYRVYGARAVEEPAPGITLLKKGVPSAGGLHPTEAYLLARRVEGIEPGLYHYHPIEHALEPIAALAAEQADALANRFVSDQGYLADAQAIVVLTSRFERNFWRYRNHAKAYRALILDVGHLSQTQYLAATELGLGAFVTAVINEIDIENAFGLDPLEEGPLAVCGFGVRAPLP